MRGHGMTIHEASLTERIGTSWDFCDEARFVVAARGSVRVLAPDGVQAFTLREGEGVFIPPMSVIGVIAADKWAVTHSVSFPLSVIWEDSRSPIYSRLSDAVKGFPSTLSLSPTAAANAERAYQVLSERQYCYELEARDLLSGTMIIMLRENEGLVFPEKAYSNERLLRMLTYIKENHGSPITLSMIAASASVSERECLRTFRKALGTSPVRFLISYRLAESVRLLESSDMQIAQIAYRTGFESPAHFSRSFRELYGVSPTQWRRRLS